MKTIWKKLLFALALMVCVCTTGITAEAKESTIQSGVYIGDIDVSGMTPSEAISKVNAYVQSLSEIPITLKTVNDSTVTIAAGELGLSWNDGDILKEVAGVGKTGNIVQRYKALADLRSKSLKYPMNVSVDKALVEALLTEKCAIYDQKAINAALHRVDGAFQIEEGQTGYALNVSASVDKIASFVKDEWNYGESEIALVVDVDEPQGKAETLSKVKDVLGTFTTSYKTSGASRSTNVANGCRHLNGRTLYPGESLSVLSCITPFSIENGYQLAGSYLNGQVVESLGGGICQVSTTLYNAVLLAELQVDERSNHSMIVSYVDPSADAAIAESSGKDFIFTNNTEYPIYIEGITRPEKTISFTIYGVETRPETHKVRYESEVLETTVPPNENIIMDASLPVGYVSVQSVHIGYKARLWKIVTEDGVEVSRTEVNSSNYKAVPRTATVGMATADPNALAQMQAAVATGNIDFVRGIAGGLAAQAAGTPTEGGSTDG